MTVILFHYYEFYAIPIYCSSHLYNELHKKESLILALLISTKVRML